MLNGYFSLETLKPSYLFDLILRYIFKASPSGKYFLSREKRDILQKNYFSFETLYLNHVLHFFYLINERFALGRQRRIMVQVSLICRTKRMESWLCHIPLERKRTEDTTTGKGRVFHLLVA